MLYWHERQFTVTGKAKMFSFFFFFLKRQNLASTKSRGSRGQQGLCGVPDLAQTGRGWAGFCSTEQLRDKSLLTCSRALPAVPVCQGAPGAGLGRGLQPPTAPCPLQ